MKYVLIALTFLSIAPGSLSAAPSLSLSTQHWEIGRIKEGTTAKKSVKIRNTGDASLTVAVKPSCDCVSVSSYEYSIPPGREVELVISLSSRDPSGDKAYYVFFETNDPGQRLASLRIETDIFTAYRKNSVSPAIKSSPVISGVSPAVQGTAIEIYGTPGCSYCDRLSEVTLPALMNKYRINAAVNIYPLDIPKNFERLVQIEEKFAVKRGRLPAVLIGNTLLEGKDEIDRRLEKEIAAFKNAGIAENAPAPGTAPDMQARVTERINSLSLLPLIAAGLTDGINPCAFAGIIFLVSYLGFVRKHSLKMVAVTGILFIAGIFTVYFLIGLGLSTLFTAVNSLHLLSKTIYILAGSATLVLSFLSFHDYYAVSRPDKQRTMILQLPPVLRTKIFSLIETFGSSKYIVPLAFFLGVGISFLEFFCTGQIYLPTIMYMVRIPSLQAHAILYLALYSFVFVLPLIIILVSLLLGLKNDKITGLGRQHIKLAKMLTGFVFLALSFLIFLFVFR